MLSTSVVLAPQLGPNCFGKQLEILEPFKSQRKIKDITQQKKEETATHSFQFVTILFMSALTE